MKTVISEVGAWCSSIVGLAVIFLLFLLACRQILALLRREHDEKGLFYRSVEISAVIGCAILISSMIVELCTKVVAAVMKAIIYIGPELTCCIATAILVFVYVALVSFGYEYGEGMPIWFAAVLVTIGVYVIWRSPGWTFAVGLIAVVILLLLCGSRRLELWPDEHELLLSRFIRMLRSLLRYIDGVDY